MNCWRCGTHSVKKWLAAALPFEPESQISQLLKKYQSSAVPKIGKREQIVRKRIIKPPMGTGEMTEHHRKYLTSRGFYPIELEKIWDLKGTQHLSREWSWRVITPIHNQEGVITAYTGRSLLSKVRPKWKITASEDMGQDPRKLLYGIEKADPSEGVVIVEGPSDVWRLGPGAVGVFGIDWTPEQANILRRFSRRFIVFDPESIAQSRAFELASWLSAFPGHTEVISGLSSDPGDLSPSDADNMMRDLLSR